MSRIAGSVKTTPAAIDSPAEPVVWTMLFSRIVERPRVRKNVIASTAIGIEARDREPDLERQVHARGGEDDPQDGAQEERPEGELGRTLGGRDERREPGVHPRAGADVGGAAIAMVTFSEGEVAQGRARVESYGPHTGASSTGFLSLRDPK